MPDFASIKAGDRITFRAATRWSGRRVTRVVTGRFGGLPTVRFGGWSDFVVRLDEISHVQTLDGGEWWPHQP